MGTTTTPTKYGMAQLRHQRERRLSDEQFLTMLFLGVVNGAYSIISGVMTAALIRPKRAEFELPSRALNVIESKTAEKDYSAGVG